MVGHECATMYNWMGTATVNVASNDEVLKLIIVDILV